MVFEQIAVPRSRSGDPIQVAGEGGLFRIDEGGPEASVSEIRCPGSVATEREGPWQDDM